MGRCKPGHDLIGLFVVLPWKQPLPKSEGTRNIITTRETPPIPTQHILSRLNIHTSSIVWGLQFLKTSRSVITIIILAHSSFLHDIAELVDKFSFRSDISKPTSLINLLHCKYYDCPYFVTSLWQNHHIDTGHSVAHISQLLYNHQQGILKDSRHESDIHRINNVDSRVQ